VVPEAEAKLLASNANNWDRFGTGVAIDGDTAVVGAYLADSKNANRGAAYIWGLAGGGEPPVVSITSPADGAVAGTMDVVLDAEVTSQPTGVSGTVPAGGGIITGVVALTEGSNQITITATDATLCEGSAAIGVTLDTTSPVLSIVSPEDGDNLGGLVEFTADASDDPPGTGISHVELIVDGNVVATLDAPPYSIDLDTTTLNDSLHTFAAAAYDNVGNMSMRLCPRGIVLFKGRLLRFPRIPIWAKVTGVNTDLLLPIEEHDIVLQVPGGSPVPAIGACDTPSRLKILFDRRAFANSIRAGIQSGVIPTPTRWNPVTIKIDLVADGFVIGTVTFKIRDPFRT